LRLSEELMAAEVKCKIRTSRVALARGIYIGMRS
jgi:hypothetical protein